MNPLTHFGDLITRWCVILLAAILPFFVIPLSWATIPQAKMLFVASLALIGLTSWFVARVAEGSVFLPRHLLLWGSALLPVVYLISSLLSHNVWSSVVSGNVVADTAVVIALWYVLLALTAFVFSGNASVYTLLRAVVAGICALVVFQIFRLLAPDLTSLGGYLSGNAASIFGSWHDLGIIAALGVFLATSLWFTQLASDKIWRAALIVMGLGSLFLVVIVNSADVWFALSILTFVPGAWSAYWLYRQGISLRDLFLDKHVRVWLAVAIVSLLCGFFASIVYGYLPAKFQVVQLEVRPSWMGTYLIGQQTLSSPKAIIFGSGPNTFNRDWGLFKPAGVNQTEYWNVDFNAGVGFIPTTLVTTGLSGLIAWAVVVIGLLLSLYRFLRLPPSPSSGVALAIIGGALYLFAFHIMYLPGAALSALLFIFLGAIVAIESGKREPIGISMQPAGFQGIVQIVAAIIIIGALVLAPLMAIRAVASNLYVQRAAVIYNTSGNLDQPLTLIQSAISIFPENDIAHRAAVEIGLLQLAQLVNSPDAASKRDELQGKLQNTITHGLSAVSIDSADYQNWLSLAVLYRNLAGVGIDGAYENARDAYSRTITENPTNPLPHIQLAQLALSQNDAETAIAELNKALELKPNLGAAYFLRSQIKAAQGQYAPAVEDAGIAAQLVPQDPVGWYNLGSILYAATSYDLASQALGQAVALQNNYANAMFLLALSWDNLGRRAEALTLMRSVLQLNPNDETVKQMVDNLAAGKPATTPQKAPAKK